MTEYSNIPKANALHVEQETVLSAITMIDSGGTMPSFSIAPNPNPLTINPNIAEPVLLPPPPTMMAVNIATQGSPPTLETMESIKAWLIQRSLDIDAELAALGITDAPVTRRR